MSEKQYCSHEFGVPGYVLKCSKCGAVGELVDGMIRWNAPIPPKSEPPALFTDAEIERTIVGHRVTLHEANRRHAEAMAEMRAKLNAGIAREFKLAMETHDEHDKVVLAEQQLRDYDLEGIKLRDYVCLDEPFSAWVEKWLTANGKQPSDVLYGLFPLGMVGTYIENAKWFQEKYESERSKQASGGAADIASERARQITSEGWTLEHDDEHRAGEMAVAAACYAVHHTWAHVLEEGQNGYQDAWPWEARWDKRNTHDHRRCLVIAGAVIAAEIDRLDRVEAAKRSNGVS